MSRELAFPLFERMGCHPDVIHAETEGSGAVWLLAALFMAYSQQCEAEMFPAGRQYQRWPHIFWHPAHRPPERWFMGRHHKLQEGDVKMTVIQEDAITLRAWLAYARKRLPVVERYGFFLLLVGMMTGENRGALPKLMQVWETAA